MPSRSLVIDGGNVIRCDDKVIMVEKGFIENPYHRDNLEIGIKI